MISIERLFRYRMIKCTFIPYQKPMVALMVSFHQ